MVSARAGDRAVQERAHWGGAFIYRLECVGTCEGCGERVRDAAAHGADGWTPNGGSPFARMLRRSVLLSITFPAKKCRACALARGKACAGASTRELHARNRAYKIHPAVCHTRRAIRMLYRHGHGHRTPPSNCATLQCVCTEGLSPISCETVRNTKMLRGMPDLKPQYDFAWRSRRRTCAPCLYGPLAFGIGIVELQERIIEVH